MLLIVMSPAALAGTPVLYSSADHESPVRGAPDDLLLLAGDGLDATTTVVYRAIEDTTAPIRKPPRIPTHSNGDEGVAPIVSSAGVPRALTIKLPRTMREHQAYALWVQGEGGVWSTSILINDARPLWISPAFVYSSSSPATLPRELKVIGRNLEPSAGHSTQIRLIGPQTLTGIAIPEGGGVIGDYAARLALPPHLPPGAYRVLVNRDGNSWVELRGQLLDVLQDAPSVRQYSVGDLRFGGCRPDDGVDDTACVVRAVAAAGMGGGTVNFGAGTWDLIDSAQAGVSPHEGIVVPAGVRLVGVGSDATRLNRHAEWNSRLPTAAFTLTGGNVVTGLTFRDLQIYKPTDRAGPQLQLGEDWQKASPPTGASDAARVSRIVITRNVFDEPMVAIMAGGLPIDRLLITFNTFGAYNSALELTGDPYDMLHKFRIDDSVIDYNVFKPGSELDLSKKTGAIASELGAGHRLDFSSNTADGTSTDFLYSPGDAKGWRATFFWTPNGSAEEILVSNNIASCTGDKIGDGEAIAFDNNLNTFALAAPATAVRSTANSATVMGSFARRQHGREVPNGYYDGHWVQVVSGPGLGESRKIVSYTEDSSAHLTTINVVPDWDVAPLAGSTRIAVGRQYWQVYALDNQIDNRRPLCQKSNRSRRVAGAIEMWGQSSDSVIAGNRQYDSDGIFVQQNYGFLTPQEQTSETPCAGCTMMGFFNYFMEIRENLIDGEYDWANDCSKSGIALGVAAAPWAGGGPPPTVSFGVSISHNVIRRADAEFGGAIAIVNTWFNGPDPQHWPLSDNVLIDHNQILEIDGPRAFAICGTSHARVGIAFPAPGTAWRTVLYANSCENVPLAIGPGGVDSVKVCPSDVRNSCECR